MLDAEASHKGVRITATTPEDLVADLINRRNEIKRIAEDRRPVHARGKLSEVADGVWSVPTVRAVKIFGATGLQLNGTWAQLPPDWQCPCCNRQKSELIIFESESHVAIAHAVEHHDHFAGYVNHAYHRDLGKDWFRNFPGADEIHRRLVAGVTAFDKTVVCEACNHAEGRAKALLRQHGKAGSDFLEYFSFSVEEIRHFIRPVCNAQHRVSKESVFDVFANKRKHEVMAFRKSAVDVEVRCLKEGIHWRSLEASAPDAISIQDAYIDAVMLYGLEEGSNSSIMSLSATDQDLKTDPDAWITAHPKRCGRVPDSMAEDHLAGNPDAQELGPGWCCPCCDRSTRAALRWNNKRKLAFQTRNVSPEGQTVAVCLDCHLVMTRLSGSAGCDRDDVSFEDVREVSEFRTSEPHRVRSSDVARSVIERVRARIAAAQTKRVDFELEHRAVRRPRPIRGRLPLRNSAQDGLY